MTSKLRTRAVAAVGVLVCTGLALTGCGGKETASPAPSAAPTPSKKPNKPIPLPTDDSNETVGPLPQFPFAPLTGQRVTAAKLKQLQHPAVVVKISDVPESQPEINLEHADMVICQPNGPSYTRLAAVFHSKLPDTTGPVRSVRPGDAWLITPLAPVFANSDASQDTLDYVRKFARWDDIATVYPGAWKRGAYSLAKGRVAPNHVLAHPKRLLAMSKLKNPPKPYFAYAANADQVSTSKGSKAATVSVPYGKGYAVSYKYDARSKRYLRWQPWGMHKLASGRQASAKNVVILEVYYRMVQLKRDLPVPVMVLNRKRGKAYVVSDGKLVVGQWTKKGAADPFQLVDAKGRPIQLAPGNTWVELPLPKSGVRVR